MSSAAETEIRELISKWEQAVRDEDFVGIRSNHAEDFLMFDVPPPFLSQGLDSYIETWKVFFESQARPITFYLDQIVVTVGDDVAFATAVGSCGYVEHGQKTDLKFRLTMGFQKKYGQWLILHEHHSIPAEC